MDALVSPGKRKHMWPRTAASVAQILMQSAERSDCCESVSPGGLHTIQRPLSNIVGNNSQIVSLRNIL